VNTYHEPRPVTVVETRDAEGRPVRIHYECRDCGHRIAYAGSRPKHLIR
jgi:hypothetical protein